MMKNIILDCDLMKYRNSGLYFYCLNLGNYVQKIFDQDQCERMKYYVPASEKDTFRRDAIIEKKWHRKYFKPFLWNCNVWHAPFQSGRIVPRYHKEMKIVLTIHDLNILYEDKPAEEKRDSILHTQKLIDNSDAIVCISEHCKKDVLNTLIVGNKPVYVIHNGTHDLDDAPDNPEGYKPRRPFVFTLGYVNKKKNFHTLLSLLKQPELELIIAGRLDEPDYVTQLYKRADELGVSDRLKVLGPVAESDKAWYYKHSSAFAFPSLAEGFGAPVVEAMKYGKPIFLSNKTSLPEIGGNAAFYFSNFEPDHMISVFREGMSTYVKNDMAPLIIARGKQFDWQQRAMDYVNVYRSLY